jgi:hypothetical protein
MLYIIGIVSIVRYLCDKNVISNIIYKKINDFII